MLRFSLCALIALSTAFLESNRAHAAVIVLNGGMGQICYEMTRAISKGEDILPIQLTGSLIGVSPYQVCTMAIAANDLASHDLAGTHNNRGVLLFMDQKFSEAIADFDQARRLDPEIAEAHVNYGASMVALHRWAEGLEALNKGIEMQPAEPEKAYFNRAIANEELGHVKEAYLDYLKASELAPDWEQPRQQLTRFTVRKPGEAAK